MLSSAKVSEPECNEVPKVPHAQAVEHSVGFILVAAFAEHLDQIFENARIGGPSLVQPCLELLLSCLIVSFAEESLQVSHAYGW